MIYRAILFVALIIFVLPVSAFAAPPVISNVATSSITGTSANITFNTDVSSIHRIDYGLTTSYGTSTNPTVTPTTNHGEALSGLTAGTLYHYRIVAQNASDASITTSGDYTFTTLSPPVLSNVATSSITGTSANITFNTDVSSIHRIDYGLTASYGTSTSPTVTPTTNHGEALSGLSSSTTYHYRIVAQNASDSSITTSGDYTFTTLAPPVISNVATSSITGTSANITFNTDVSSIHRIDYGLTTSYGTSTNPTVTPTTNHGEALSGLTAGTLYHYRIVAQNASDASITTSGDYTFTTSSFTYILPGSILSEVDYVQHTNLKYAFDTLYNDSSSINATTGAMGANQQQFYDVSRQRGATDIVLRGIADNDASKIDLGIKGLEYGFQFQEEAGNFSNAYGYTALQAISADAFFMQAVGHAALAVQASSYSGQFLSRFTALEPKITKSLNWMAQSASQTELARQDTNTPNRLLFDALAYRLNGNFLNRSDLQSIGDDFAEFALTKQTEDGIFLEKGGYDSGYQGVNILVGSLYLLWITGNDSLKADLYDSLGRAVAWEKTRINSTTGEINEEGNTRTGSHCTELSNTGKCKNINYGEVSLSLLYWSEISGDTTAGELGLKVLSYLVAQYQNLTISETTKTDPDALDIAIVAPVVAAENTTKSKKKKQHKKKPVIKKEIRYGERSNDVKKIQIALSKDPSLYPEKLVTGYYGDATKRAIMRFQEKYKKSILKPAKLKQATGTFDYWTRKKFNKVYHSLRSFFAKIF